MKILYAIQGTGNGHLSRAREIIPLLRDKCEVDILVSGYQSEVELPFEVKYKPRGLSFMFGKKGGVDLWNTYIEANSKLFMEEVRSIPVRDYDFVINDFEPVSAWACHFKKVPCIAFSHQCALLDKNVPRPKKKDFIGSLILKNYAPSTSRFGLHFCKYSKDIFTPVIRSEIRNIENTDAGHYTVYLPSYDDSFLLKILQNIDENIKWQVFSKRAPQVTIQKNVEIYPVTNDGFIRSMASSTGVLCGAGFETPAEAMFLGKKLMVVPMQNQYEQQCNAAALKAMGVPVIKKLKEKHIETIREWISSDFKIEISYPDITARIVNQIFESFILGLIDGSNPKKYISLTYPAEKKTKRKNKLPAH
ncbi:MAG: hypothetical protein JXB34_10315 [Bacteroidales bacterium]|nr:hypothetical protein [Bacteroidales bacterium]